MSDELSPATKALLARGRDGIGAPPARRTAVRNQVLAKAAAGTIVTTSATAAAWTTAAKLGVVSVVVMAAVGAGALATRSASMHEGPKNEPAQVQAPLVTSVATALVTASAEPVAVERATQAAPEPVSAPSVARGAREATPTLPAVEQPKESRSPTGSMDQTPATGTARSAAGTLEAPTADPPGTESPSLPPARDVSLAEETRLLRSAHVALAAGDGATALRLLDEHAVRFPTSAFEPERSAERILAFCATGATENARAATHDFLKAHPTGPLATRVKGACGAAALP